MGCIAIGLRSFGETGHLTFGIGMTLDNFNILGTVSLIIYIFNRFTISEINLGDDIQILNILLLNPEVS